MKRCLALVLLMASCAAEPATREPAGEDAVPIYRSLNGRFPKLPKCIIDAFEDVETDPAALNAALASQGPLLDEVARATRARRCDWTYDRPPCISGDYPLDFILLAARPLVVRARVRLRSGDVAAALDDFAILARFGNDLSQDRWMIGHLLGCICQYWACDGIQDWIRSAPTDALLIRRTGEKLELLLRRFPSFEARLRHEKEMSLPLLEDIRDLGFDETIRRVAKDKSEKKESHPVVQLWEEWLRTTLPKDMERVKETVSRRWDVLLAPFLEEVRRPFNSRRVSEKTAELKKGSRALSDRMARNTLGGRAGEEQAMADLADLLFLLWAPASEKAALNHELVRLGLTTTALACRLELGHLKSGRYPETLAGIDAGMEDPFVGGPLRYRRVVTPKGEGYVVAAAGPKDDAETRMRVLSEECEFDKGLFEKKNYEHSDATTFGTFRRR